MISTSTNVPSSIGRFLSQEPHESVGHERLVGFSVEDVGEGFYWIILENLWNAAQISNSNKELFPHSFVKLRIPEYTLHLPQTTKFYMPFILNPSAEFIRVGVGVNHLKVSTRLFKVSQPESFNDTAPDTMDLLSIRTNLTGTALIASRFHEFDDLLSDEAR